MLATVKRSSSGIEATDVQPAESLHKTLYQSLTALSLSRSIVPATESFRKAPNGETWLSAETQIGICHGDLLPNGGIDVESRAIPNHFRSVT
jgi:hypothetical protein